MSVYRPRAGPIKEYLRITRSLVPIERANRKEPNSDTALKQFAVLHVKFSRLLLVPKEKATWPSQSQCRSQPSHLYLA
jgi:hypothetical protein